MAYAQGLLGRNRINYAMMAKGKLNKYEATKNTVFISAIHVIRLLPILITPHAAGNSAKVAVNVSKLLHLTPNISPEKILNLGKAEMRSAEQSAVAKAHMTDNRSQ